MRELILRGLRQNNLKDIDLNIPLGRSVVVSGPSGSGKSSLAFETIYAEGQRRYMQSLSTYARQFMEKFQAPLADRIQNIPPTIAVEQTNPVRNSRTTVGTSTELYDYFRLLFEKVGRDTCPKCDTPMERWTLDQMAESILSKNDEGTLLVGFLKTLPKQDVGDVLQEFLRSGYSRAVVGTKLQSVEDLIKSPPKLKEIVIIVDRLRISGQKELKGRLSESLRAAMANQTAMVFIEKKEAFKSLGSFTTSNHCPKCGEVSLPKSAAAFSFNNPLGACENCRGFGNRLEVDPELIIPNPKLSIAQGAIEPFTKPSLQAWHKKLLAFCKTSRIDMDLPYRELPEKSRLHLFEGGKGFKGIRGVFQELEEERYKMRIRVFLSRYQSPFLCTKCNGSRLNASGLRVKVGGKNISEISDLSIEEAKAFFKSLKLNPLQEKISEDILSQVERRLDYLGTVGLGYLNLSRLSRTLSGGEYQRILLATQLSQGLTDTLYVLDEPSIGLHSKDTERLLKVLSELRARGNSLVIVEHDPEIIEWAEHIIDLGPGAGRLGGEVTFSGSQSSFQLSNCETAKALKTWRRQDLVESTPLGEPKALLQIQGASSNNLKNISVDFPLGRLVAVTGVSGSGKSTLVVDTLYQALAKIFHGRSEKIGRFKSIRGFENLQGVELIDQEPIGKSSRSNPITFIKGYDEIRSLFASTRDATGLGLAPGHFSFNVPGGRCETCEGEGRVRIDMVFMEDVWIPCEACQQKRFKPHVLNVRYQGKNIDDVLSMTVEDAFSFFEASGSLRSKLALLSEVGLSYLQLGQSSRTLSGGEAQRLKIARELSQGTLKRVPTLFILDEPTTGLHFNEISRLLYVLKRLLSHGHSVIVIEHNLQLICAAHNIVDLGPDGGDAGGHVVAVGTPKELAAKKLPHTGLYLSKLLNQK